MAYPDTLTASHQDEGGKPPNCVHLCIVNLVIGALYCAKGNYEYVAGDGVPRGVLLVTATDFLARSLSFGNYASSPLRRFGISRIIKSMDPHEKKLNPDTWYYSKRCFLALAEMLAKHMVVLKDKTYEDIIRFFDLSEARGAKVPTVIKYTKIIEQMSISCKTSFQSTLARI